MPWSQDGVEFEYDIMVCDLNLGLVLRLWWPANLFSALSIVVIVVGASISWTETSTSSGTGYREEEEDIEYEEVWYWMIELLSMLQTVTNITG